MYKKFQYILTLLVALCSTNFMYSQENDTIQTDVINVVKTYTPTISDAFKVKTLPAEDPDTTTEKKTIDYNIVSVPVASTFVPTKGKASLVTHENPEIFFDNYINFGYGSYGNLVSELYVAKDYNRIGSFSVNIAYDKSKDGIENENLDDSFSKFKTEIEYINRQRDLTWSVKGGLRSFDYNWYGIDYNVNWYNVGDVQHNFFDLYLTGDLAFEYTYLKSASLTLRRFYDDYDSGENHLDFNGNISLPILDEEISTDVRLEYFMGHAGERYGSAQLAEYGNVLLGISPKYELRRDNFTLNVGASIYYMLGLQNSDSNLYVYPNITGSYRIVDDVIIAYGGLTGDVIQNTYRDFAQDNPYISPTINVKPTDNSYNAYVGMLGKFSSNIGYNIKVGYTSENDKSMFRKNAESTSGTGSYLYGNSFTVIYDDVKTIHGLGEVTADVNRFLKIGLRAEYKSYDTYFEEEAWNLPKIKASVFGDYISDNGWFAGANIFYVGQRKDQNVTTSGSETIDLDGYFDLNLNGGFNLSNMLTVYLKLNNITAQNYEQWTNYSVQGFQILGGVTYKLDF